MRTLDKEGLERRPATYTVDADEVAGNLYYFALTDAAKPPYRMQRHVEAILDIADDGTLAGVELIDNMPPAPAYLDRIEANGVGELAERFRIYAANLEGSGLNIPDIALAASELDRLTRENAELRRHKREGLRGPVRDTSNMSAAQKKRREREALSANREVPND